MKRLSAILCTVVMLFCSSCGTGLPELDGPVSIDDVKIDIKDSHILAYLSENCQIDADISGTDIGKMSGYNLYNSRLSEETLTGVFMPGGGFESKDNDDGSVEYTRDKEKLVVNLDEKSDAYIEYIKDKDKKFDHAAYMRADHRYNMVPESDLEAIKLVKEKLDELSIGYSEFFIHKVTVIEMNEYYDGLVKDQKRNINNGSMTYLDEEILDESFKFTDGDDCYVIEGPMTLKGFQVYDSIFSNMICNNIHAAISSRGLEYLSISPFYSAEEPNHETPVIPIEKALKPFFQAYSDNEEAQEKLDIKVGKIFLSYKMNDLTADGALKGSLDPVWTICYSVRPLGGKDDSVQNSVCQIDAADGNMMSSKDSLFTYFDPDDIQEDDEDNVPSEDLA